MSKKIIEDFHKLYYESETWRTNLTAWMGIVTWKCPFDLWVIQELLFKVQPDFLIETGTAFGGSALFFASIFELIGRGQVITIDDNSSPYISKADVKKRPIHSRILYITGSSIDSGIAKQVSTICKNKKVMVNLDAMHKEHHVYSELNLYGPLVSIGSYIIVEDTNVNGNPVAEDHGPGPNEAVKKWLAEHLNFQSDHNCERLLMTFNPGGYLQRLS